MKTPLSYLPLASGLLVLVLSLAVAVLTVTSKKVSVSTKAVQETASLALNPASGDYLFDLTTAYPVGIVLDSGGKNIDGLDAVINFDPAKAQVVDTKISPTTLFEEFPINLVDNKKGQIKFSALTFSAKPATGIVGTFKFRPLAKGEINFTIYFIPGATTDSNIAEHGTAKDVLGGITNGRFVFR
ncbi:hypothetical protein HY085_01600 [Candidatus Gottesmanbacteria bacterium]|nr:hypothetical protein [Candidatus Gottesmanbacteria bacterium]